MNDFMSAGVHRLWKKALIEEIGILKPKTIIKDNKVVTSEKVNVLDVAAGSGDITFQLLNYLKENSSNPF